MFESVELLSHLQSLLKRAIQPVLDARLKVAQRNELVDTINRFNKLMTEIANSKADSERKAVLLIISQKLRNFKGTIAEDHRVLVNESDCVLSKSDKLPSSSSLTHYIFLFNDCILICEKAKASSTDNMKVSYHIPLNTLTVEKAYDSNLFFGINLTWEVQSKHAKTFIDEKAEKKTILLGLISANLRDSWINNITEVKT